MYEVIVIGATFAAAGIAQRCKEGCLVIEPSAQAGYEFFGALHFGSAYEKAPATEEALVLHQKLYQAGTGIYGGNRHIYPYFKKAHVLFGTHLVSVQKKEGHFVCVTHSVNGFSSYEGKRIVDTTCRDAISSAKTYNFLMESRTPPILPNVACTQISGNDHFLVRCPVPLSCGYPEARQAVWDALKLFSENQRLILTADVFDYQVKAGYPKIENGILLLPAKAYESPVLAFDAGLLTKEVLQ